MPLIVTTTWPNTLYRYYLCHARNFSEQLNSPPPPSSLLKLISRPIGLLPMYIYFNPICLALQFPHPEDRPISSHRGFRNTCDCFSYYTRQRLYVDAALVPVDSIVSRKSAVRSFLTAFQRRKDRGGGCESVGSCFLQFPLLVLVSDRLSSREKQVEHTESLFF